MDSKPNMEISQGADVHFSCKVSLKTGLVLVKERKKKKERKERAYFQVNQLDATIFKVTGIGNWEVS